MKDFKRNKKHFPEKIARTQFPKQLTNQNGVDMLQFFQIKPKGLHTTDYTQLYDFLKYNQKEVDDQRAERLAKTHDPLALMANSNNPFNYPVFHQDQPSPSTYMQQPQPINNNYIPQPSFNQNFMQQPIPNPDDITDPTTAMNMALALMAKAFKLNYSTPTNNNQRISSNPRNRQIAQPGMNMGQDRQMRMVGANGGNQFRQYAGQNVGYQNEYNAVQNVGNQVVQDAVQNQGVQNIGNGNVVAARAEGNAPGNNASITSVTQTDKAPVYESDGSAEKLENENVELSFQVRNYEKEIAHLKTTYKNLFDSISVTRAQTKTIIDSLQNKLHDTIYENAKLRAQLFDKVSDQVDTTKGTSTNTKFANQKVDETNDLSNPVTSNSVPTPQESKNVIAPGMFRINPFKPSREEKYVPNKVRASVRTTPITVSQPHVVTKKDVNSDSNGLSSTGVDNTAKTRRPQPRSNTKNDRVPSASKSSCNKNKEVEVEEHHRNLLLSKNKKHMSSECKR
ncbi:hypothetical protein Tco_1556222 [Tanacetum coccineum]